jgi:hypothetical protein
VETICVVIAMDRRTSLLVFSFVTSARQHFAATVAPSVLALSVDLTFAPSVMKAGAVFDAIKYRPRVLTVMVLRRAIIVAKPSVQLVLMSREA